MSRIIKAIPNTITSMNLLCGVIGVVACFHGRMDMAFVLMLAAAVFDFCDGLAARLLKAYSDIGKELDSLADEVSFGVLPSLMLCTAMVMAHGDRWYCYIPLLLSAATALRLAKFNLDERQHSTFLGLPAPACAMVCGSFADICAASPHSLFGCMADSTWGIPLMAAILSLLLLSEIPMFSMKFAGGGSTGFLTTAKRTALLSIAVLAAVVTAVGGLRWSAAILITFLAYILMNVAFAVIPGSRRC